MKKECEFAIKNDPKKLLKIRFGSVLGSIWEGLGEVLGGIWSLVGLLGSFLELFFSCLYLEWSSKVVLEASGLDFGSILQGLGRILGGFGMGFRRDFEGFGMILADSGLFWLFWAIGAFLDDLGRLLHCFFLFVSCFFLLALAFSCFSLACSCFVLLSLACSCFLLLSLAFS